MFYFFKILLYEVTHLSYQLLYDRELSCCIVNQISLISVNGGVWDGVEVGWRWVLEYNRIQCKSGYDCTWRGLRSFRRSQSRGMFASANSDIVPFLQPDVVISLTKGKPPKVINNPNPLSHRLRSNVIVRVSKTGESKRRLK